MKAPNSPGECVHALLQAGELLANPEQCLLEARHLFIYQTWAR
jgi:hypothetical protein